MLNRYDDSRVAELLRQVGQFPPPSEEAPAHLRTRLCAYARGAARARSERGRGWLWLTGSVGASLTAAAVLAIVYAPAPVRLAPLASTASAAAARSPRKPLPSRGKATVSPGPRPSELLAAADWRSRRAALVRMRASAEDPSVVRAVAASVRGDPHWKVRLAALAILARGWSVTKVRALADASRDPNHGIRIRAVEALGRDPRVLRTQPLVASALLRRLHRDPNWRVREVALQILLRSPESERAATIALADRHRRLREQARKALALLR